jgi:hypothetical protein
MVASSDRVVSEGEELSQHLVSWNHVRILLLPTQSLRRAAQSGPERSAQSDERSVIDEGGGC